MADREKVFKGLEYCTSESYCTDCPYESDCWICFRAREAAKQVMRDALELLKEQEAVEPQIISDIPVFNPHTGLEHDTVYKCGNCGMPLIGKANYCFKCGRKVKWDAADY